MATSSDTSIDLNGDWAFHPGRPKSSSQRTAEAVHLPHSWNTQDTFQTGVDYRRGRGSYYMTLRVDEAIDVKTHRWMLCADGFWGLGTLFINGKKVADFDAQYLGFECDLTPWLRDSKAAQICIMVSNLHRAKVLPGIEDPDFLLYGGLAANLTLEKRPLVSIPLDTIHIHQTWNQSSPELHVRFEVENLSDATWSGDVQWTFQKREKAESLGDATNQLNLLPGERRSCHVSFSNFNQIDRWSVEDPRMYLAVGQLKDASGVKQTVQSSFGFREISFSPAGKFMLNGEELEIHGCNRHESMPGFGNALPTALHVQDAALIKSMGLNAVRLSHYPQNTFFLDACDELGILVYAEIASWKTVRTGSWLTSACRQLEGMIRRDRNHPSVILWGLGNESRSKKAFAKMTEVVRALDPHRFTIYAENHLYRAKRKKTLNTVDVWGCNYELDLLEELKDHSLTGAVVVSECSNQPHAVRGNIEEELKQIEQFDRDLNRIDDSGASAGYFIWSFQDYATLRKKRYGRYCGLVDAWREPKMAACYLTARLSRSPCLKVFAHVETSDAAFLLIITNCSELDVKIGGEVSRVSDVKLINRIPILDESKAVKVLATRGDTSISAEVLPVGVADRLHVDETHVGDSIRAIDISVMDVSGHLVGNWEGMVQVSSNGAGRLYPYTTNSNVWITGGTGRFYASTDEQEMSVEVRHVDLVSASLTLTVQ